MGFTCIRYQPKIDRLALRLAVIADKKVIAVGAVQGNRPIVFQHGVGSDPHRATREVKGTHRIQQIWTGHHHRARAGGDRFRKRRLVLHIHLLRHRPVHQHLHDESWRGPNREQMNQYGGDQQGQDTVKPKPLGCGEILHAQSPMR